MSFSTLAIRRSTNIVASSIGGLRSFRPIPIPILTQSVSLSRSPLSLSNSLASSQLKSFNQQSIHNIIRLFSTNPSAAAASNTSGTNANNNNTSNSSSSNATTDSTSSSANSNSTATTTIDDANNDSYFTRLLDKIPRLKSVLIFSAVFGTALLIVKIGISTIQFFSTIDFLSVGEGAFIAGLVSGVILVGVFIGGIRAWQIRPETVYQLTMKKVQLDIRMKHILGNSMKSAAFKAYSFVPGHIRWSAVDRSHARQAMELHRASNEFADLKATHDNEKAQKSAFKTLFNEKFLLWYKPKSLQLFFQLNSPDNSIHAMVSAEVEKTFRGEYIWNILSIDFMETGDRIVLEGDPEYKIYQGIIKLR